MVLRKCALYDNYLVISHIKDYLLGQSKTTFFIRDGFALVEKSITKRLESYGKPIKIHVNYNFVNNTFYAAKANIWRFLSMTKTIIEYAYNNQPFIYIDLFSTLMTQMKC